MIEKNGYRPQIVEFEVNDSSFLPEILGEFETIEDVDKFIAENELSAINEKLTVFRKMDSFEKKEIRKNYQNLLENLKPAYVKALELAEYELGKAKDGVRIVKENLNSNNNTIDALAIEVKTGLKEINLDAISTLGIAYNGKKYYYTYIDGVLKKCKVQDLTEKEKSDIYNVMGKNSVYFEENFLPKIHDNE